MLLGQAKAVSIVMDGPQRLLLIKEENGLSFSLFEIPNSASLHNYCYKIVIKGYTPINNGIWYTLTNSSWVHFKIRTIKEIKLIINNEIKEAVKKNHDLLACVERNERCLNKWLEESSEWKLS